MSSNPNPNIEAVRQVLQQFQDAYTARDLSKLDEFMQLFVQSDQIELIGIGASVRGGNEWFQGVEAIREIIESDWTYWGDVIIDVKGAKISLLGEAACLSTGGELEQTDTLDEALPSYLDQMAGLLSDQNLSPESKLMEATHFGLNRMWERHKGTGYRWPFVITATLLKTEAGWRFHTVHWSMPVS